MLGPLEVRDGEVAADVGSRQRRAVLAVLLASANQVVSSEALVHAVWNGQAPPAALGSLRAHISRLRGVLGRSAIVRRPHGYLLRTGPDDLDADVFARDAVTGRDLCAGGEVRAGRELLAEALALWRGEAYEDFRDDDWARVHVGRLTELRLAAVEARVDADLRLGRHWALAPELESLVDAHPGRDRLWAQLMVALYRCDRPADAVAVHRHLRESDIEPSPQLRRLEQRIRRRDPDLDLAPDGLARARSGRRRSNVPSAALTSFVGRAAEPAAVSGLLARHRLVSVVGPGGAGKTRLALRVAADEVGSRQDGVWWVDLSAARSPTEVVSAVHAALGFAPPASEVTERRLQSAYATERRLQQGLGVSPALVGLLGLVDSLAERSLLLVLDGCETVTAAVAELAGRLLSGCPDVDLLCTSREPLAVAGERVWPIPPLEPGDALRLFLDRAAGVDPVPRRGREDLAAVSELCRRVDGLPLGIELAAAQLRDRSPAQVLARLPERADALATPYGDLPPHRGLTDVIAGSHELLGPTEQRLFAALAVLEPPIHPADAACLAAHIAGPTPAAPTEAPASCGALVGVPAGSAVAGGDVVALLGGLVDRGLLVRTRQRGHTHYRMPGCVRAFAGAVLDASGGRAAVEETTARHFAELAVAGRDHADDPAWADAVRSAEPNLVAALRWCVGNDPELGARAFLGLAGYLAFVAASPATWLPLGRDLCDRPALDEDTRLRLSAAVALVGRNVVPERARAEAQAVVDHPGAPAEAVETALLALVGPGGSGHVEPNGCHSRWIAAAERVDTPQSRRIAAGLRALLAHAAGDLAAARRHLDDARPAPDAPGSALARAFHFRDVAEVDHRLGDTRGAAANARSALAAAEAVGSPAQRAMAMAVLATILAEVLAPAEALPVALEAATVAHEVDSHVDLVDSLTALALCCVRAGRHHVAARVVDRSAVDLARGAHGRAGDAAVGVPSIAAVLAEAAAVAGELPRR